MGYGVSRGHGGRFGPQDLPSAGTGFSFWLLQGTDALDPRRLPRSFRLDPISPAKPRNFMGGVGFIGFGKNSGRCLFLGEIVKYIELYQNTLNHIPDCMGMNQ